MCPNRIEKQFRLAAEQNNEKLLIGSKYKRIPEGSTDRYTQWANEMTEEQLYTQVIPSVFLSYLITEQSSKVDLFGTWTNTNYAHMVLFKILV